MCRLAWQLLGMLGNVLGHPRHVLQRPKHAWQRPRSPRHAFSQGPRSLISKKNPPICCLISCEAKGVVYHQTFIGMFLQRPRHACNVLGLLGMLPARS